MPHLIVCTYLNSYSLLARRPSSVLSMYALCLSAFSSTKQFNVCVPLPPIAFCICLLFVLCLQLVTFECFVFNLDALTFASTHSKSSGLLFNKFQEVLLQVIQKS